MATFQVRHLIPALFAVAATAQLAVAQQPSPQPAAQPAYPSASQPRAVKRVPATPEPAAACESLQGLERDECLRRDVTDDDDRPAGVTTAMHEQDRVRQQREEATPATAADSAADADRDSRPAKPTASGRTRTARVDVARESSEDDEADAADDAAQADEVEDTASDSIDPPRQ